ncbi:MAG: DUF5686 and carboxypeptidase regulatory-like domain-containing protein [Chitinophagaceae bacterium]
MKCLFLLISFCCLILVGSAQGITGTVTDSTGLPLAFATISVLSSANGTTSNNTGKFSLSLPPGSYTLTCRHIGYQLAQQEVELARDSIAVVNFHMMPQELVLAEVVVTNGEDPANEIIRQVIRKRALLRKELQTFTADVYGKSSMQLRGYPKKFLGQAVDFEDGDTSGNKVIFLSETVARYAIGEGNKSKVQVIASRVSGQSDGFGLSLPTIISFYENNITIGENLNSRGFVSPVADGAFRFYKFKYEGAFFEDGRQVSRIRVIPKRQFEPLFKGYINIIEDSWHIHSLNLLLLKSSGLNVLDSLTIEQLYVPVGGNSWMVKSQVLKPSLALFGFNAFGSFLNVYGNYNTDPAFPPGFFDRVVLGFADSANKKSLSYWSENRPLALHEWERLDYQKKDSLEKLHQTMGYVDSMDRIRNKLSLSRVLFTGITRHNTKNLSTYTLPGLIELVSFNTVEGAVVRLATTYFKKLGKENLPGRSLSVTPVIRYGFSNRHFNNNLSVAYSYGRQLAGNVSVSGGSNVFQFNNAAPVGILGNTLSTLLLGFNDLKIYEARYGRIAYSKAAGAGITFRVGFEFQARSPLENTSTFTFSKAGHTNFTTNLPLPLFGYNINRHEASIFSLSLAWQPGTRYIKFPGQTLTLATNGPEFKASYTTGIKGLLGGDVSYGKWLLAMQDDINLKLPGSFKYKLHFGGFATGDSVAIPDYIHYQGNMSSLLTGSYLDRFQLVPHYYFSYKGRFYSVLYAEHHFNGFITNKVPFLRKLKWNLVAGANGLYQNGGGNYLEPFVGLENIFGIIRLDYIMGLEKGRGVNSGFRAGIKTAFKIN